MQTLQYEQLTWVLWTKIPRSRVSAVSTHRPILRALMCAAVGFAVLLSGAVHAYADPPIGEIEQQIDAEWNKLEPAIEQYNNVHTQLKDNQAKLATLQRQLQPLQLQVDVAM